ncbi:putative ribonuclease H-like domain-containing protein [Tanacetum coccineum]
MSFSFGCHCASFVSVLAQKPTFHCAFSIATCKIKDSEENLHIRFSENTPNAVGSGPYWLFDIDALTRTMNYEPIFAGTQSNGFAGINQEKDDNVNSTNTVNAASTNEVNAVGVKTSIELPVDLNMPALEDYNIFDSSRDDEDDVAEADIKNLDTTIQVSSIPTTRIHKDHPLEQIEAIQEELLQFKLQEVWTLVDLPNRKMAISTKWGFRNKKDERGTIIRNKARLVAQRYTQVDGIDYDDVFSPVARIKAIRLFLAYASFKDFVVYQMDVKSAFLYGKIEEEVYVCQPPGFEDPDFLDRVYKVEKALYGLHQAPRAWYETLSTYLLDNEFQRGKIDKTLFIKRYKGDILLMSSMGELIFFLGSQVQQKKDDIFICQDKYVDEILKKFGFIEVKTTSIPIETQKPLLKDEDGKEVDVHMYRSMIDSLMYLTSSRPDIMFAVCTYVRYQVNLKVSHLLAVKRIFSDYAGASLDRKSTIGGYQFLRCRLISWQCKKQTVVANSITEAEYVAASSCCGQAKTVNGEIQLQALVDGKKIIITKASVRSDIQLDDEEGMDCLSNATIFEELTRMGYEKISQKLTFYKAFFSPQWKFLIHTILQCPSSKTTAWNEFSSTMAFAIICLATNQKFNFSKYIFESMVKNLENVSSKFLMYPRFVQVFLEKPLEGMSNHNRIHVAPTHTKKIFRNMKRVEKRFYGRVTPLFPIMVVQAQEEMG